MPIVYTCCLLQSRNAVACGDMDRAHSAANSARQCVRISWVAGILSIVAAIVIIGIYIGVILPSLARSLHSEYDYSN